MVYNNFNFFKHIAARYGFYAVKLLKLWININLKIYTTNQQRTFLLRCRHHDVLPPHIDNIRLNVSFCSKSVIRKFNFLKKRNQRILLNLEIKDAFHNLNFLRREIENIEYSLFELLPELLVVDFFKFNKNKFDKHNYNLKLKLIRKFDTIIQRNDKNLESFRNIDTTKWILNISNKQIPVPIQNFLSLGEGFGLPIDQSQKSDRECSALEIVKNFEVNCHKIPDEMIDLTRSSVASSLHTFLSRNTHTSFIDRYFLKEFDNCKKFLANNDDVFVTKADKGQVTVIMDRDNYVNNLTDLLNDQSTYKQLKKDPTKSLTSKLNSLIKTWRKEDIIDDYVYKKLNCTSGNLPRCYGLPKVHKVGFPLRVIVSSVGSPLYGLARLLHDILQQSIKKPRSHIKDSWSFVNIIKDKKINNNEILFSLDVTALFTNIPKNLVLDGIRKRWPDIRKKTKLKCDQFLHAISFVLESTSFQFNDQFYEQIFGSPMGSPLSPVLADIVMEDLETHCLRQLNFEIPVFYRYVDDIFAVVPKIEIDHILNVFNSYHPRLKFTYEIENSGSIAFLDTLIIRNGNDLMTNWYRKPTFSGRYINYLSNHPQKYKLNTITGLVDRAILLSDGQFHKSNIEMVKDILKNNCFPTNIIEKNINTRLKELRHRNSNIDVAAQPTQSCFDIRNCIPLPYIKNINRGICRTLGKCGLRVLHSIPKKLNQIIKRGKDRLDIGKRTEVVYKINCNNCNASYIGQTKRHLQTRIKEHCNDIKKQESNLSVVSKHRLNNNHDFNWSKPQILHNEKHTTKREVAEMVFIKKHKNTINLKRDTENLNPVYDKVLAHI